MKIIILLISICGIVNILEAKIIYNPDGTPFKSEEAKLKCEKNDNKSCLSYGKFLSHNKKYKEAKVFYKKSCDLNLAAGCYQYGLVLGIADKHKKSLEAYKRSCDLYLLNGCYIYDKLSKNNHQGEKRFWKKVCDMGKDVGCKKYEMLNNNYPLSK